jgi:hypothetical protein
MLSPKQPLQSKKKIKSEAFVEHFGTWNPRQGDPLPMARISQLFDPLNGITQTHHALIALKSTSERELAAKHFEHHKERDLVLLDRGYPAFWQFHSSSFNYAGHHRGFTKYPAGPFRHLFSCPPRMAQRKK